MTDVDQLVQWLRDNPGEHRHPRIGARLGWDADRYVEAFTQAAAAGLVRQRGPGTMGAMTAVPALPLTALLTHVPRPLAPANAGVFVSLALPHYA